jgi:hypothetical protein
LKGLGLDTGMLQFVNSQTRVLFFRNSVFNVKDWFLLHAIYLVHKISDDVAALYETKITIRFYKEENSLKVSAEI